MTTTYHRPVSDAELLEKNRIYDTAADDIWRRVVYDPVHDGWEFTNMGGRHVLDYVGRLAQASPGRRVVELCSGLGDTCRYLARVFDCEVTGIELNPRQIARAPRECPRGRGGRREDRVCRGRHTLLGAGAAVRRGLLARLADAGQGCGRSSGTGARGAGAGRGRRAG